MDFSLEKKKSQDIDDHKVLTITKKKKEKKTGTRHQRLSNCDI